MRRRACVALLALAVGCRTGGAVSKQAAVEEGAVAESSRGARGWLDLTILHNNDGESQLLHAGTGSEDFGGVARFASLLRKLRAEARTTSASDVATGVLFVSSGDNILPGPVFGAGNASGGAFFDALAIAKLGYDAVALGNHDFDFGPEVLATLIHGVSRPVPFLSANLDFAREPRLAALASEGRIAAHTVVELESGHRVGVIGVTTTELRSISAPRNVEVGTAVADAVRRQVAALEAAGVDKIVLLSHLQSLREDLELIPQISGVDVVVSGGGGEVLATPGTLLVPGDAELVGGPYPIMIKDANGRMVPIVTTPGAYRYVGRLRVLFNDRGDIVSYDRGNGIVRVAGGSHPDAVEPDPELTRDVVAPLTGAVAGLATRVVGKTAVPLEGRRHHVRARETNLGCLVADALLWQARRLAAGYGAAAPALAVMNGGGIRNDSVLPPGPISALDTFHILPFSNFVAILPDVPVERLKLVLEHAAANRGEGAFLQVAGMTVRYDPERPPLELDGEGNVVRPGDRVREVVLEDGTRLVDGGRIVAAARPVGIATIAFLARGGGGAPFAGLPVTNVGSTDQQALAEYVEIGLGGQVGAEKYPAEGQGRIRP